MKKTIALLLLSMVVITGCDYQSSTANVEQNLTEENQQQLLNQQPPVKLDWSLERENINKRTSLWNNENKLSYIYLVSYGKVMAYYTVKGKVSSVNSQITNPEQITGRYIRPIGTTSGVVSSPAEDGSYGTNGDAIFFFTTEGVYVEWAGDYMLADQPLKLSTPPELVRQIN